jgi:hypothetical protein
MQMERQLERIRLAIDHTDDSHVMLKYYVRAIKGKDECQ